MIYREVMSSLFTAPQGYYLAHCITSDFSLDAGIAKEFDDIYDMKSKLFLFYGSSNKKETVCRALLVDNVFNLVVKKDPTKKAKYKNLRRALYDMRDQMERMMVTRLAIPKLGTGHEGLEWGKVKKIIQDVFDDSDIIIDVCI